MVNRASRLSPFRYAAAPKETTAAMPAMPNAALKYDEIAANRIAGTSINCSFFAAKSAKNNRKSEKNGAASCMLPYTPGRNGSAESESGKRSEENAEGVLPKPNARSARYRKSAVSARSSGEKFSRNAAIDCGFSADAPVIAAADAAVEMCSGTAPPRIALLICVAAPNSGRVVLAGKDQKPSESRKTMMIA